MKNESQPNANNRSVLNAELVSLTATAYHEAGHAVMALLLGRQIQKITVTAANLQTGGRRLGICELKKGRPKQNKDWLEDEVLILLAGMVAEAHFTGEYCPLGAGQDLKIVRQLLQTRAANDKQCERLERRALTKAEHLLSDTVSAKTIELIAAELIDKKLLSGRAAQEYYSLVLKHNS